MASDQVLARLTRPIVGLNMRTAEEVQDILFDRIRSHFAALAARPGVEEGDGKFQDIVHALRVRMTTACGWTRAGKGHVKVRTADWHALMKLSDQAYLALAAAPRPGEGA